MGKDKSKIMMAAIVFLLWILIGNKPTTNVGHDIKNLGRDVTDSVRDAVK